MKLAISPCPNDTFAFFHLLHKSKFSRKIEVVYLDIENLNKEALLGNFDLIKASFAVYPKIKDKYCLLNSGAALGEGIGPVLVAVNQTPLLSKSRVGLPGKNTTANLLLQYYCQEKKIKPQIFYERFDKIIPKILSKEYDAGVLIHEGRKIYKAFGLNLITDLGEYWQQKTGTFIPLGGIFARKNLDEKIINSFQKVLKLSIQYGLDSIHKKRYEEILLYIKKYAIHLDESVIKFHIDSFVTKETVSLSNNGLHAIKKLLRI